MDPKKFSAFNVLEDDGLRAGMFSHFSILRYSLSTFLYLFLLGGKSGERYIGVVGTGDVFFFHYIIIDA